MISKDFCVEDIYEIKEILGRGGTSIVYKGVNKKTSDIVTIKKIDKLKQLLLKMR